MRTKALFQTEVLRWMERTTQVDGQSISPCSPDVAAEVVRQARERFVNGETGAWWMKLKWPFKTFSSTDTSILSVLPTKEKRVWFIPETRQIDLPVYELTPKDVEALRTHFPPFEYYVVDKKFRWLAIGSERDEFIVSMPVTVHSISGDISPVTRIGSMISTLFRIRA